MQVVHQDETLLVVDKPAGLPTQAPRGGGDNLYDRVREAHGGYVALHHRLDTGASGLVLFVVDPEANGAIAAAFRDHRVERTYLAVGAGEALTATWTWPVDGKPACSEATVLTASAGLTALCLRPQTGRKHQLRIHAAMAGCPLVGDHRYGDAGRLWPRLALHAAELAVDHPGTGKRLALKSGMPSDLSPLWARAGSR